MSTIDDKGGIDDGTERLSDIMRRAEQGDSLAAREVIEHLAFLCSVHNRAPIPDFVKEYLSGALYKIVGGDDPTAAFNLRKKGRPQTWSYFTKRQAVSIMRQLVDFNMTIENAASEAADQINAFAARVGITHPIWGQFVAIPIDETTLKSWYYEQKLSTKP